MLTLPYVTTASFKAYPTFLDVMNLRSGDSSQADQDQELFDMLLVASAWADNYVEMSAADGTLTAHTRTEVARVRTDRTGRISYHPNHIPVTALTALSTGSSPNTLLPVPDLSNFWVEGGGRQIVGWPGGQTAPGLAALQFGPSTTTSELFCQWTYTAGYPNTLLTAPATAGATSIQVQDTTGITAGTVLRIWEPGLEEAVTVANTYTGGATLPLVAGLRNAHTNSAPTGVSGLPADIHLAVILYTAALLQRPDSETEDSFPSAHVAPNSRVGHNVDGSGFVSEAELLLEPYRRVR